MELEGTLTPLDITTGEENHKKTTSFNQKTCPPHSLYFCKPFRGDSQLSSTSSRKRSSVPAAFTST